MQTEAELIAHISSEAKRIWARCPDHDLQIVTRAPGGTYSYAHVCAGIVGDPADNADDEIAVCASDIYRDNLTIVCCLPIEGDAIWEPRYAARKQSS